MGMIAAVSLLVIYFFMKGYRNGLVVKVFRILSHIPYINRWSRRFQERNTEVLQRIDAQIAALHAQHKRTFYLSLGLELLARVVGSLEIYVLMRIPHVQASQCHRQHCAQRRLPLGLPLRYASSEPFRLRNTKPPGTTMQPQKTNISYPYHVFSLS